MGQTCGAVTGALMVLGMEYGPVKKDDPFTKDTLGWAERDFLWMFVSLHGSLGCNELRGIQGSDAGYVKGNNELCTRIVRDAGEILEAML